MIGFEPRLPVITRIAYRQVQRILDRPADGARGPDDERQVPSGQRQGMEMEAP